MALTLDSQSVDTSLAISPIVPVEKLTTRVSLVVPARNEARNIATVLTGIPDCVDEVILVDGNSSDATVAMATLCRPDIRVVGQDVPGKGAALRAGFLAATGDVIVMIDADGSMSAEEIPAFSLVSGARIRSGQGISICLGRWVERYHRLAPGWQPGLARDGQCPLRRPIDRPLLRVLCLSPLLAGEPRPQGHRFRDRDRDHHPGPASRPTRHRGAELRAARGETVDPGCEPSATVGGCCRPWSSTVGPSESPTPRPPPSCRLHPSACSASDGGGRGTAPSRCEPVCRWNACRSTSTTSRWTPSFRRCRQRSILSAAGGSWPSFGSTPIRLGRSGCRWAPAACRPRRSPALFMTSSGLRSPDTCGGTDSRGLDLPADRPPRCLDRRFELLKAAPLVSVVVATRDRTTSLARCLDSVLASDYPALRGRRRRQRSHFGRNRGPGRIGAMPIAVSGTCGRTGGVWLRPTTGAWRPPPVPSWPSPTTTWSSIVIGWLPSRRASSSPHDVAAVTGLIQPGELRTRAQVLLEQHGSFAKGFEPRIFDLDAHRPADRRFPLATGQCGSGANMAFRADCLRRLGGFDPALGTGTTARGGDDLAAFFNVLVSGQRLVYQPAAVVRHWHRDHDSALATQAYGYGVGLGAYLTDAVVRHPGVAIATVIGAARRRRDTDAARRPTHPDRSDGWPPELSQLGRRGAMTGPFSYLASRWHARGAGRPA